MVDKNELYPIFLKVHELNVLIVGGGNVALEKLTFLLKSSPNAKVQMVAPFFKEEIEKLAKGHQVDCVQSSYNKSFIKNRHMVIATANDEVVNMNVYNDCKEKNILVNLADNPTYCDFYMGGIVTKGHVKVAISTNGKSPTTAKRLRQYFEEVIPQDINKLVTNLNIYRKSIKGDFDKKVDTLNKITESLISD